MENERIASNIKRLRLALGKTQAALASRAGISRVTMRHAESADGRPSAATLEAIAMALGVPLAKLSEGTKTLKQVRFRALKKMRSKEHVIAECANMLDTYAELEALTGGAKVRSEIIQKLRGLAATLGEDRPRRLAAAVRSECGLEPNAPIPSITDLLEYGLAIRVVSISFQTDGFFGLCIDDEDWGAPAVVVNVWDRISVERWIFTAAHELGHLLMHTVQDETSSSVDADEEDPVEEAEANEFASELLMPQDAFESLYKLYTGGNYNNMWFSDKIINIKKIFGVSYKTVLYRWQIQMRKNGVSEEESNVWPMFNSQIKRRYGRTLKGHEEISQASPSKFDDMIIEASMPANDAPVPEIYRALEVDHMGSSVSLFPQLRGRAEKMIIDALERRQIDIESAARITGWPEKRLRDLMND